MRCSKRLLKLQNHSQRIIIVIKNYQLQAIRLLLCVSLIILAGNIPAEDKQPLETVSQVNLSRYAGTWYELARLPNWFQNQCVGDVTAEYRQLKNGGIEVINRCLDKNGEMDEARGIARVADLSTNAKLEVSFVSLLGWRMFWGDYWILDLGDEYEYAVIGMPSRKYAWVLSRTVKLSPERWSHIREVMVAAGYDPRKLVETQQQTGSPHSL